MPAYKTKMPSIRGTRYKEVYDEAFDLYSVIKKKTKRRPYIRSTYFNKEKIFLGLFWQHLHQKNWRDRARRIKYFPCAIDVLIHTRLDPMTKDNPNDKSELFHRFFGVTSDGEKFIVQVKEDKKKGDKWLFSVFPQ